MGTWWKRILNWPINIIKGTKYHYPSRRKESEVAQSCPILCDPMDWSPLGSSIHQIFQTRILEWVAISFSRGSSWPRDQTWVSCIAGRFFTIWATREAWPRPYKPGFPSLSRQKAYHDTLWEGASQFSKGIRSVMSVGSFARVMETF